ncbi:MAG: carbon-nitrogen hydrolase family protein [Gammaproteobacteria bacterium]
MSVGDDRIVAAIQMVSSDHVERNLEQAAGLIERAVSRGAELLVLPENFGFMGRHDEQVLDVAEQPGVGPMQSFLAEQSKAHGITLVGGTVPIREAADHRARSACLVFSPQGEQLGRYDKLHLFDVDVPTSQEVYRESDNLAPGDEPCVVDTPLGRLGLAICYDLRFPELFRAMNAEGAELFALPAAFTLATGRDHWEALLRARAIENLTSVIASGQGGPHASGRQTYGHSMVIDAWGDVADVYGYGAGIAFGTFNSTKQKALRERFPVLGHRRL